MRTVLDRKVEVGAPINFNLEEEGLLTPMSGTVSEVHYGIENGVLSVRLIAMLNGEEWEVIFPCTADVFC